MNPVYLHPNIPATGRVSQLRQQLPNGNNVLYFSPFLPFSHRSNAREIIENTLFYLSAQRFDVFSCFSSHMSRKPAFLEESARRIAANFAGKSEVVIKELGAGYGESMAILLSEIKNHHPQLYQQLKAYASDGYAPVLAELQRSRDLQPFLAERKLIASHEDLLGALPCQKKADYVRISYTLTDLPEDLIKKENGQFFVAKVRGYINGTDDFATDQGSRVPAEKIAELLEEGKIQEIIDLGLDIRTIQPRIGYEVEYRPIDYTQYAEGWLVKSILEEITAGIDNTHLRMGLNAAQAIEKVVTYHLANEAGSTMEIFDIWTTDILAGMPAPYTGLEFTSVNSVNLPFIKAYLKAKSVPLAIQFEDWKQYINQTEPYIYLSHFSKWLKGSPEEVKSILCRALSEATISRITDFLEKTRHVADMVLFAERGSHPFIKLLRAEGFSDEETNLLFASRKFLEPVKSQTRGFYGLYQVVTLRRK